MNYSPYIITVNTQNFTTEVIEKSRQVPVLVDFWAAWCAPCKMILPVLTKLADEYQGKFILAKVNTDEEQQLASQYSIRSIPALKLFRQRQIVEDIMGAQPESVLRDLIDRHCERPADRLRSQATAAHLDGNPEQAIALLEQARNMEPSYYPVQLDLAKIFIDLKRFKLAQQLLKDLPINIQLEPEVNELIAHLTFSVVADKAPAVLSLEQAIAINPDDHQARYQLSAQQVLTGDYETAMAHLLEIMRRDRSFENDAGRKGLLAIFTLLGNQNPIVSRYRSKMSSLLY
ncbi:MAG: thioredoxin [Thioploca sp.]|nr:thioredoxin [Thioploca sp.]